MLVPGHASCPWVSRDNVNTLVVAKDWTWLLILGQGYFFVCHSVCTAVLRLAFAVV